MDNLKHQRLLAAQTIQRSIDTMKTPTKKPQNKKAQTPPTQDNSMDYLHPNKYNSIDFSAMATEKSIMVDNTPTKPRCSFEPLEFTARSTTIEQKRKTQQLSADVETILASSFVENVRNLSNCSFRESLAKTADMSKMSSVRESQDSMKSFLNHEAGSNHLADWMSEKQKELSQFENETFHEASESLLLEGERAWENEYALIPSAETTARKESSLIKTKDRTGKLADFSRFSAYLSPTNISLDNWNKRSDNLMDVLTQKSPPKRRPVPLVDTGLSSQSQNFEKKEKFRSRFEEDKENSDIPNLSSIPKLLSKFDNSDSPNTIVTKLLQKSKSCMDKALSDSINNKFKGMSLGNEHNKSINFMKEIEGEAVNSTKVDYLHSDTASFTESLLQSSIQNAFASPKPVRKMPTTEDTYRVPTAKKAPVQKVIISNESENTQNLIKYTNANNRKRRSSSTSRIENLPLYDNNMKRSRSPCNPQEMKAVSGTHQIIIEYSETPKTSQPNRKLPSKQQYLSPEPRYKHQGGNNRSPSASPTSSCARSIISPSESNDRLNMRTSVSPMGSEYRSNPLRSASQCSSVYNRDGMIPLKSTHCEISWPCVKLRDSSKKTFQIKNMSHKKLAFKITIEGPGFQLNGDIGVVTLQAQECKSITLDFCPTTLGPAIGHVTFQMPHDLNITKSIPLFGYGGHSRISVEGIMKGPTGPSFILLGYIQQMSRPLEKSFILLNKGTVTAFATFNITASKDFSDCISVSQKNVHVPANKFVKIILKFRPRKKELQAMIERNSDVITVGNLHILWGEEPTRLRIKQAIKAAKLKKYEGNRTLWEGFPVDNNIGDLSSFTEVVDDTICDLFTSCKELEIALTVNRNMDDSIMDITMDGEQSIMFKSICSVSSSDVGSSTRDIDISPAIYTNERDSGESWSIRPTYLEFSKNNQCRKQFTIKSNFVRAQFFELKSNHPELFMFTPEEGQIYPGNEINVSVDLIDFGENIRDQIHIIVYIENEKITIPVYIKKDFLTPVYSK